MGDLIRIKRVTVLLAFLALLSGLLRAQGEPGSRSAADVQRDLGSRPKEVLDFFDPQPGWRIIDLFAGDGYYSELLHQRVGPRGRIYLHNSQATQPNPRLLRQRLHREHIKRRAAELAELREIEAEEERRRGERAAPRARERERARARDAPARARARQTRRASAPRRRPRA